MRIRTITCHNVYNFGASLQAYALMKYLQNLGHQVEIIDYKPDYAKYNLWAIGEKYRRNLLVRCLYYLYVVPRRMNLKSRRQRFDLFTQNMLTLTLKRYQSFNELKNDPPEADVFLAGSDQIWNVLHDYGKDPAFYLDFVPMKSVRASYAASFSISQIPVEYKDLIKSKLAKFDAISVREKSGLKILDDLKITGGNVVMDPVFLLDRRSWELLASSNETEKYILIYDQENNSLIKKSAIKLSKMMKLKIYAIESLYPMIYAEKKIKNIGPLEFLGLIKNCEILLTNSFHGTAFGILFQKEFFTFKRIHEKVNSRMIDLLETLHLSDRLVDQPIDNFNAKKIDYQYVSTLLSYEIQHSKEFIEHVLKIAK